MVSALPEQGLRQKFMRLVSHARRNAVAIRVRVKRGVIRVVPSVGVTLARRRRDVIPVRLRKAAIPVVGNVLAVPAIPVTRVVAERRIIPSNALSRVYNWRQNVILVRRKKHVTRAPRNAILAAANADVIRARRRKAAERVIPVQQKRDVTHARPKKGVEPGRRAAAPATRVRRRKAAIPVLPRRAVERATPVRRRGAVIRAVPVTPAIHVAELQLSN